MQINSSTHASTLRTLSGGGFSLGTDASSGDSEGGRLTADRYLKLSNNGTYGSAAGLGDLSTNLSHNFQSNQNNTVLASISSSTGSSVTSFDAFLPTGSTGLLFQGSLNAIRQFAVDASGNLFINAGSGAAGRGFLCRAWANMDGTGTPAFRASGNMSSITDNGAGDYTINMTSALPDANYSVLVQPGSNGTTANIHIRMYSDQAGNVVAPTTSSFRFAVAVSGAGAVDVSYLNVSVFR